MKFVIKYRNTENKTKKFRFGTKRITISTRV